MLLILTNEIHFCLFLKPLMLLLLATTTSACDAMHIESSRDKLEYDPLQAQMAIELETS